VRQLLNVLWLNQTKVLCHNQVEQTPRQADPLHVNLPLLTQLKRVHLLNNRILVL
jgi:hypothetical protein